MHPLIGTWIANIAKSTRHENHKFASSTMRFDMAPETASVSEQAVRFHRW